MNTPLHPPSFDASRLVAGCAYAAAALVLCMFGIFVATGIGQDPLQSIHPPAQYSQLLLRNPSVLRAVLGLDNAFIVAYATMFLGLAGVLWRGGAPRLIVATCFGLLAASALLDLLENLHFLAMIAAAQQGLAIAEGRIHAQVLESLAKFHLSYFGLFLLGWVLPRRTRMERALCFALRWVQLPVGMLIYLVPSALAVPLVLGRFSFFLFALLTLARTFSRGRSGSGALA